MTGAPLRFTFVIARYGDTILGGAERLTQTIAERLAARGHDVRVFTTCARSYATWANEFPPGLSTSRGVEIRRFAVGQGRTRGDDVLKWMSSVLPGSAGLARRWIRAQGPVVPELLDALPEEARHRDLLVFIQLLSYPTVFGLPRVASRSVLVPLVHKERGVGTTLARRTLRLPRALFANTGPEAAHIADLAGPSAPPIPLVAVGLEPPPPDQPPPSSIRQPYVVFLGRTGKMAPLLQTWQALTTRRDLPPLEVDGQRVPWSAVALAVVGGEPSRGRALRNVVHTGYVDEATRWSILRHAVALVNPSIYESLSLVLLEAWSVGRPVVVNTRCDVTTDLVRRSQGGVAVDFTRPMDASGAIASALASHADRAAFGRQGGAFAARTFAWDRVLEAYECAALDVRAESGAAPASRATVTSAATSTLGGGDDDRR